MHVYNLAGHWCALTTVWVPGSNILFASSVHTDVVQRIWFRMELLLKLVTRRLGQFRTYLRQVRLAFMSVHSEPHRCYLRLYPNITFLDSFVRTDSPRGGVM